MMKFTGLELMNNGVDAEKVWMSFERKMSCAVASAATAASTRYTCAWTAPCSPTRWPGIWWTEEGACEG